MRLLLTAVAAILLLLCCAMGTSAQEWSNLRSHDVEVDADTLTLDTLSVIPESFKLHYMDGSPVGSDLYVWNGSRASSS
jgi:hypothetical protein